jgi:hypothetical protein
MSDEPAPMRILRRTVCFLAISTPPIRCGAIPGWVPFHSRIARSTNV